MAALTSSSSACICLSRGRNPLTHSGVQLPRGGEVSVGFKELLAQRPYNGSSPHLPSPTVLHDSPLEAGVILQHIDSQARTTPQAVAQVFADRLGADVL